ncbi:MAG: carboxylesterase family protein [Oscillospiraceae bacterium]|nr:carboxylesterase family protein [Oscillospiraceae bacterium]
MTNREKTKRKNRSWPVLFAVVILLMAAVLELGKHTLLGWILAAAAAVCFALLRGKKLGQVKRLTRFGAWCALLLVFGLILWLSWPPVRPVPAVRGKTGGVTETIHIAQGDLTGVLTGDGRVEVYAGIPYAKPPVGELRWREPQRAEAWQGVLAADHFAPMSMQTTNLPIYSSLAQIIGYHDYRISLSDNSRQPVSEDSLYLNIWKPAGDVSDLPVLVYIHGGSLQTGQPWYEDYSGESLARDGVIVVNMGYRLGIFGFFADEDLAGESENGTTGNYGLLDQIMALEWVRDNIAAFGGDPDNVTLAGESAGSACVTALCTSPLAKGLFRRVVAESSTVTAPEPGHSYRSMEDALSAGAATKRRFGVQTASELRALPAEQLADELSRHHHMTVDGYVLPRSPWDAYAEGVHNEEAQMHGCNAEEAAPFLLFGQASLKDYESRVRRFFPDPYAEQVLALYPAKTDAEAKAAWADINNVVLFTYGHYCFERQALENGIPSYVYYFVKDNGRLGAWHSGEEVYLYGNIPDGSRLYDASDRALSAAMKGYFLNFIRTGDPNGGGLPAWPAGTGENRVLELGSEIRVREAPYQELHAILDAMYGIPAP